MSALLHPTGPERTRTYWIRRVVVLAVLVVVVLVLLWAFLPDREGVRAVPGAGPGAAPTAGADASPSGPPTPTATPTQRATTAAEPSATGEASATGDPSEEGTSSQGPTPDSAEPTDGPEPTDSPEPTEEAPVACTGSDLVLGLDGSSRPEVGEDHELEVTVRSDSGPGCLLGLDREEFELRIYSGTDRIWTTDHCERWISVPEDDREEVLAAGETRSWTLTWPVRRSGAGCELVDPALRPGTYVATVRYADADPAQLVMVLR